MDRLLKLVYPCQYEKHNAIECIYNGLHPYIINYLKQKLSENPNEFHLDSEIRKIFESNKDTSWRFANFNTFYNYARDYEIVNEEGIINDNFIYLYPVEICTVIRDLINTHKVIIDGKEITFTFIDTIPKKTLDYIKAGKVKIVISIIQDPCTTSNDIVLLEKMFNSHGISGENVVMIWGNNYQKIKTEAPDCKIKMTYGILPLPQTALIMESFPKQTSLGYVSDVVRESDLNPEVYRKKRFLCFNRTMKPHRYMLAHLFLKHDLFTNSIVSFLNSTHDEGGILYNMNSFRSLNSDINFNRAREIKKLLPYQLDTQELNSNELWGFPTESNKKDFYLDTYVHITSETLFTIGDGKNPFFSEKTFRPIQNLQPFIFVGEPFSLLTLKSFGFKTFSPFIDEKYDTQTNHAFRMKLIEREIVKLNNMTMEELHDWYYSMTDILLYNQNHLKSFAKDNPFEGVFNDINTMYST